MDQHDDWDDEPQEPDEKVRDQEIDKAGQSVLELIGRHPERIFYSTEIETNLERDHFHWITAKALLEASGSRLIKTTRLEIQKKQVNFYTHKTNRYFRRGLKEKVALLERIYAPEFTRAVGATAELLFDAALARKQFTIHESDATSWQDRKWTKTRHNLDRIVSKDGVAYGIEIKNTQNYINRDELDLKLDMCKHLRLRPLFILRFAPKTYIHRINSHGGFALLFDEQIYPMGHQELMLEARKKLGLKVHSPKSIKEGDMQRLVNWHQTKHNKK
jgi:hypothetical protein